MATYKKLVLLLVPKFIEDFVKFSTLFLLTLKRIYYDFQRLWLLMFPKHIPKVHKWSNYLISYIFGLSGL